LNGCSVLVPFTKVIYQNSDISVPVRWQQAVHGHSVHFCFWLSPSQWYNDEINSFADRAMLLSCLCNEKFHSCLMVLFGNVLRVYRL